MSDADSKAVSDAAIDWFARLHSDQATTDDWQHFSAWREANPAHARAYDAIEKLWAALDEPAEQALTADQRRANARRITTRALPVLAFVVWASIYLPGMLRLWASDYRTDWGERREWSLPDGSTVMLNTHSTLALAFSNSRRTVRLLEGEAYFQVARDPSRPFTVSTDYGTAQAIGTAFDVDTHADSMTVTVSEGHVRVQAQPDTPSIELAPGWQASSDARGLTPSQPVELTQTLAWRSGILAFDMQPLVHVVATLNRYLPGRIILAPRMPSRIISGAFDLTRPQGIVDALEKTLKLRTVKFPGGWVLFY
jgi:transmembrane sensor